MEKMNWIEKITEAVRVSMNKGMKINEDTHCAEFFIFSFGNGFRFYINKKSIVIYTSTGYIDIKHDLTEREDLELRSMALAIKDYNADMATSELDEFISDKKDEITDINNLDDDD